MKKKLNDDALNTLFREARSYNTYLSTPMPGDIPEAIWELMKWGPTSTNQVPARFVWCMSETAKTKLSACCSEKNRPKIMSAPITVIVGMDINFHEHLHEFFPHSDVGSLFRDNVELRTSSAFRNSSLQGAYLIVAARALGFDVGPMSGFNGGAVDKAFFADQPSVTTNFIATLGVGDPDSLFERLPRPIFSKFNRYA